MNDYIPLNYEQLNLIEGMYNPSQVYATNPAEVRFWMRSLYQRAMAAIDFNIPDWWNQDYFKYVLSMGGFIAVFDHPDYGVIPQWCSLHGYGIFLEPKYVNIANAYFNEYDLLIGKDCALIKFTPDYHGIYDVIHHYAEKLALISASIDMNAFNSRLAYVIAAKNKAGAEAIKKTCPNAWVINLTNPMTVCCKTLYDVFPKIKAFGCCHEVFHAEEFLCCVLQEILGIERPSRKELTVDASGINHFTWITEARYGTTDVMALLPAFCERFYDFGYCEKKGDPQAFRGPDPFLYGNKVKMDLYRRFGALGAAGDRHLVEFLNNSWYLKKRSDPEHWLFHLTEVEYRMHDQKKKISESEAIADGRKTVVLKKSDEELIVFMKAILGYGAVVSNANVPNIGQMQQLPLGAVVETNCVFDADSVRPISANPLPGEATALVRRNSDNMDNLYAAIHARDLKRIFEVFMNQPLCSTLSVADGKQLFRRMCSSTEKALSVSSIKQTFYEIPIYGSLQYN